MKITEQVKKTLTIISPIILLLTVVTMIISKGTFNDSAPPPLAPTNKLRPVQQVFKSTDSIKFMLDLTAEPKVYQLSKLPKIAPVYAETNSTYTDENLTIETKITNTTNGRELNLPVEINKESDTKYIITAQNDKYNFVPGKYKVEVDVTKDNTTQTFAQDFNWGVLAVNTNKATYSPGETANIAMAVLDERGNMVCDAEVTLDITDPDGNTKSLTTGGEIIVNPGCSKKEYTEEPDYETTYKTGVTGEYKMNLTAITPNGSYTIQDSFNVSNSVLFDVERKTATRIYPPAQYPVTITIKPKEDFSGVITEKVPSSFDILYNHSGLVVKKVADENSDPKFVQSVEYFPEQDTADISRGSKYTELKWSVNLKAGDEYQIQYTYKAPDISPEFYLLGPITLEDSLGNSVFIESRKWQIAADAITYITSNTDTGNNVTSVGASLIANTGDLLVLTCGTRTSQAITLTGSGWTTIFNQSGTPSLATFYKLSAGGTEDPSCSWASGDYGGLVMSEFSNRVDTDYPIDQIASATGSGDDTVECPQVSPNSGNHLYVSTLAANASDDPVITWTNSFTERAQVRPGGGNPNQRPVWALGSLYTDSSPQSTVVTVDGSGSYDWLCHTVAFNEEIDRFDGRTFTDDDEGTPISTQDVCAVYNNGTPACTTTDGSGYFSIEFDGTAGTAGDQLTFFLDGGTNFGNTVTVHDDGNIISADNLRIYEDHVITRYEQGTDLSIADMDAYDNDQNATDMLFTANTGPDTLTVEYGNELFVQSGYTFAPTGNITSSHDIEIDGTWTAAASETVNLSGSYKLDSGGTLNPSTSTITFDGTAGTEDLITTGAGSLYNLVINDGGTGTGLTVEVEDPLTVANNLTITGGALDVVSGEDNQINVGGNWDVDDEFYAREGTVVMDGSAATTYTIDPVGSTANDNFYNLTLDDNGGGAAYKITGDLDADNNITITSGTLDSNGNDIYIGGNWTNDGIFLEGTGTVTFDGATNASIDSGCADEASCTNENFYNLVIEKSALGTTVDLANTHLRVTNLLDLNIGTVNQNDSNVQLEGGITVIDIAQNGKWSGLSTGNFTLGGGLNNDGYILLNANGATCGDDDDILIRSTAATQRAWDGSGTFEIVDVDVQYQAGTAEICAQSSTDSGNNGSNWTICFQCYAFDFEGLKLEGLEIN